jgi:cysteine desulfurase / selenocysteine lyase
MPALNVNRIRRDFPILSRQVNGRPLIYLDSAATSQKPLAMIRRICEIYERDYARVEQGHTLSREATKAFEGTRAKVAELINAAEPREIVFTRGATEALNLMAMAFTHGVLEKGDEILVTELEHHSNIVPWLLACRQTGATLKAAPILPSGDLDLERLEPMLTDRVRLLAVSHVSNVTGGVMPVKRITSMAHARGIEVMVDGAQAVPHLPVDVREIGCEYYAGSGHKMGGPSSVGFLYGRADRLEALPLADGGSTMAEKVTFDEVRPKPIPHKYEAGEPAFGEVEAWGPAIDYWAGIGLDRIAEYERELSDEAAVRIAAIEGIRMVGDPADRISIVSFAVDGVPAEEVAQALDREGIAVRAGNLEAQPLLAALGVEEAMRASFMFYNTREEVDVLVEVLAKIASGAAAAAGHSR